MLGSACVRKFISFFLVSLVLMTGAARAEVWFCEIEERNSNGGWIPPALAMGFEPDGSTVLVGMIMGAGMIQADGQILRQSNAATVISFRVDGAQDRTNRTANLDYRLNFNRARQSVTITMRPLGYDNFFRSSGTCALQQQ